MDNILKNKIFLTLAMVIMALLSMSMPVFAGFGTVNAPKWIDATAVSTDKIDMMWDKVLPQPVSYRLSWSQNPDAEGAGVITRNITAPTTVEFMFYPGDFIQYKDYYFKVKTIAVANESGWSPIRKIFTMDRVLWTGHYKIASTEATMNWGAVNVATTYEVRYKPMVGTVWTTIEGVLPPWSNPADSNPNRTITGLIAMTSYEVQVRAQNISGEADWKVTDYIYTLERPWADTYKPTTNEVYVTWGPEVSSGEITVPNSSYYQMQYRINGGTWVITNEVMNNSSHDDATNPKLSILFDGLVSYSTYEYQVRTVDTIGGVSDWSDIKMFHTVRPPYWASVNKVTTNEASVNWDDVPRTTYSAVSYEVSYGTDEAASNWGSFGVFATNEAVLRNLTINTTYYLKVRAIYAGGIASDWCPIVSFITNAFMFGPYFVNHYAVTSREVVVNWSSLESAVSYEVAYRVLGASWNTVEVLSSVQYNPLDLNPNYRLTGLTPISSYEVRVRGYNGTQYSNWSTMHNFYTLERPWADFYKPGANEAYITWGPEVNTTSIPVPLAASYQMQYRINGGTWILTNEVMNNSSHDDATNTKLNILFDNLTNNTTYEFQVRAVDGTGGVSEWSGIKMFHTLRSPWWIELEYSTTNEASLFWDSSPEAFGATSYDFSYGTDASGESLGIVATLEPAIKISLPTPFITYYAKARAVYPGGVLSDWTPIKSFSASPRVTWIAHYLTTVSSTQLTWEGISGITSYEVNYGVSTEPMVWTSWAPVPNTFNYSENHGGPITGLLARTWYQARARAFIGAGASDWSSIDKFFTISTPNNFSLTSTTNTTASITWESVDMGGTPCTSYEVSWGTTPDASGTGSMVTSDVSALIAGLATGETYYVKVRALDPVNGGWSDWTPYPPVGFIATNDAVVNTIDIISGWRGATVMIKGTNLGAATGTVTFGAVTAQPGYWKPTEIAVSVPPTAITGSNTITIATALGNPVVFVCPNTFNVLDGGFVLDDMEGGVWHYATWEYGGINSVISGNNYTASMQGNTHLTVEVAGTARYEILGGVSPYGDEMTEAGYDLSTYKKVKFWIRNDGPTTFVATFELVESNAAAGSELVSPYRTEVYKYQKPVVVAAGAGWQQVTVDLTIEGISTWELESSWGNYIGNLAIDFAHIKAFHIYTCGSNPKAYSLDYVFATNEGGGIVNNIFITREGDAVGSNVRLTWEVTPAGPVDIWTKTGTFDVNASLWTKEFASVGGTQQIDSSVAGKVGSGTHKWYKIMPAGATLLTADLTQEVLGKFDISLTEGYNLISAPIITYSNTIEVVIGSQLIGSFIPPLADKIYKFKADKSGYEQAWLNSTDNLWYDADTGLQTTMTFNPDIGYWVELATGHTASVVTIVGYISNTSRGPINITTGYNLVGSTQPLSVSIESAGLVSSGATASFIPPLACKIYSFKPDKSGYEQAWLNSADGLWYDVDTGLQSTMKLSSGNAYWVEELNNFSWSYPKQY